MYPSKYVCIRILNRMGKRVWVGAVRGGYMTLGMLRFVLHKIDGFCAVSLYFARNESKYMKGSKYCLFFFPKYPNPAPSQSLSVPWEERKKENKIRLSHVAKTSCDTQCAKEMGFCEGGRKGERQMVAWIRLLQSTWRKKRMRLMLMYMLRI